MSKLFKDAGWINIYKSQSTMRILIPIVAIIIGAASIIYTNYIIEMLKEREKKLINVFAKTQEYVANEINSEIFVSVWQEIIVANEDIPVILTDANGNPSSHRNIYIPSTFSKEDSVERLREELEKMSEEYDPIVIELKNEVGQIIDYQYIYYRNSFLLNQLRYYPYVQLSVIAIFGILVFISFSYSKTAEQNRVWVGLAKETAHQLGTPLSSLMAWVEYFKADPDMQNKEVICELEKDVKRFELITARFSNIGSVPTLKEENIFDVITETINYLQVRISKKVRISIKSTSEQVTVYINKSLFEWVIENITKNAVDAMSGSGAIVINIIKANEGKVIIDISDTGKGIAKSKIKEVFKPGYTTKQRGWGLGLTLAKRIIENYHNGKIYIKASEVDVGTTFRIILLGSREI